MWKDIIITALSIGLSLALVIVLGKNAEACDDDICAKRQESYIQCIEAHGIDPCKLFEKIVYNACL